MAGKEKVAARFEVNGGNRGKTGRGNRLVENDESIARLPRTQIHTQWELVTPEVAMRYRSKVARNRHFSSPLAALYRQDMDAHQWQVTHEGIAFDVAGDVIDGQHRLDAIIESKKAQWLLVTRGLPLATIEVINRGRARTLAHQLQILGHEIATSQAVAIARAMYAGPTSRSSRQARPTDTTIRKFLDTHKEALLFAQSVFNKPAPPAQVAAVLARVYYHAKPAAIARFGPACLDCLAVDDQKPGDRTARLFWAYLTTNRTKGHATDQRTTLYRKTQRAVRAFLDGEDLQRLYEVEEDLFPLS